jgi:two-component system, NarL family, nitrate/nitrite response regulator NarL
MRILLADDHNLVREALVHYLTRAARDIVCAEAADLEQVKERLGVSRDYDMIILDFRMPGMNGLAGLETVRELLPEVPVVIMSGQIDRSQAMEAMERGAAGVIRKDLRGTALLGALRLIAGGETYLPPALATASASASRDFARAQELRRAMGNLTAREFDCIRHLGRGLSNRHIAGALAVSEVTVKGHLNRAFKKMGARNRSDAVRIAIGHGLDSL